jgi:hypothetical protein
VEKQNVMAFYAFQFMKKRPFFRRFPEISQKQRFSVEKTVGNVDNFSAYKGVENRKRLRFRIAEGEKSDLCKTTNLKKTKQF